jgi:hypothetical protein
MDVDDENNSSTYSVLVSKWKSAITTYVNKKYDDTDDRVDYIENIMEALEERIDDGDSKSDIYEALVEMLEELVEEYEDGDYDDLESYEFNIDNFGSSNNQKNNYKM